MVGALHALGGLLLLATPADASVQKTVGATSRALKHCFERIGADEGRARLRFEVGDDRRARRVRAVVLEPNDDRLRVCLIRTITALTFESEAVGADVVYPVLLDRSTPETNAAVEEASSSVILSIAKTKPLIGQRWMVVDQRGRGVSDLALARYAADTTLEAELSQSQTTRYVLMAVEGVAALSALGVAGYSGYRLTEGLPDDGSRNLHIGLTAGGVAVGLTAGVLLIYHVWRALDLIAGRPVMHHLDYEQAQSLIATSNGGG